MFLTKQRFNDVNVERRAQMSNYIPLFYVDQMAI